MPWVHVTYNYNMHVGSTCVFCVGLTLECCLYMLGKILFFVVIQG